jgi:hypothetical protein
MLDWIDVGINAGGNEVLAAVLPLKAMFFSKLLLIYQQLLNAKY